MRTDTRKRRNATPTFLAVALLGVISNAGAARAATTVVGWGRSAEGQVSAPSGLSNVLAIAAGGNHSLALTVEGSVISWGYSAFGLTNGPATANLVAVAGGGAHSLALTAQGRVIGWGDNFRGQCNVPTALSNVVAIAAGFSHSLALTADGRVVGWGDNSYGQTSIPVGLSNIVAIAGGGLHSLALTTDGRVVGWGQTTIPSDLDNIVAITAGYGHSLALTAEGRVIGWGANYYGETTVPQGLSNVVAVAAGTYFSLALTGEGRVAGWGNNTFGQVNTAWLTNITAIAAGGYHSLALTAAKAQTILFGALPAKIYGDAPFTLTATASSRLPVSFSSSNPAVVTLNGIMATIVGAGSAQITAMQPGNGFYSPAPPVSRILVVNKATQAITFGPLATRTYGNVPFVLTAVASSGLPASYTSGNPAVATISGNIATLHGAGQTVITAVQSGNANFLAATPVSQVLIVNKAQAAMTFEDLHRTYDGLPKPVRVTTNPARLPVNIAYDGSAAAPLNAGSYAVVATVTDANYEGSTSATLEIAPASQAISFKPLPERTLGDLPFLLAASASSGLPATFTSDNPAVATVSGAKVTLWGAGSAVITASQPGNANFLAATPVAQTLTVNCVLHTAATAGGTVTRDPNLAVYPAGSQVTLTAAPKAGCRFVRWSGAALGNANPLVVRMDTNQSLMAVFTPPAPLETLEFGGTTRVATVGMPAVFVEGAFTIAESVGVRGSAEIALVTSFPNGTLLYTLDWSEPSLSSALYTGPFNVRSSAMLRTVAYNADFTEAVLGDPVAINVLPTVTGVTAGGGSVAIDPPAGDYFTNALAVVTATAAPGWTFLHWLEDAAGTNFTESVTMNRNKTVRAVFGTGLNTNVVGGGSIVVSPEWPWHPYGRQVRLTAVPTVGNSFAFWAGAASGKTNNPLTFTVTNANPTVTAVFASLSGLQATALTVISEGGGQVTLTPPGNRFPLNSQVVLQAVSDAGQEFLGWGGDATGSANPLAVTMFSNQVITATFTKRPRLSGEANPEMLEQDGFRLTFSGEFGTPYEILASEGLSGWTSLGFVTNTWGTVQFTDSAAGTNTHRAYRARAAE